MLTASLILLAFLIASPSIAFFVLYRLEKERKWKLEQEQLRLESEYFKKYNLLVKEKLLRANIFLREMALEFSLIFPTIDWSVKISSENFYNKYRALWSKVSEVQVIADLYAPSIKELVEELDQLTLCYWRYLYKVLVTEESIDCSSPNYLEAEKYSQVIPTKIDDIRQKIEEIAY